MSSIHGHEVLHMMLDSAEAYTTEGLISAIEARFGADARFHTCSASDVYKRQNKGKFVPQEAGFTTAASKICQH